MIELSIESAGEGSEDLVLILNGNPWRRLSKTLFSKPLRLLPLFPSEEDFFKYFEEIEVRLAKSYALRVLSRRPLLSVELAEKLEESGISKQTTLKILSECEKKGYLNDREYLLHFIAREQRKGRGKKAILFKLKSKKGVDPALLSNLLQEAESEENILEILLVKIGKKSDLTDPRIKQKVIAKLARRGFSFEQILNSLRDK